uniref:SMB domain-containing protein n=1 Tax=Castor canadensis TaxID=51338 RepID=A0A8C0W0V8_CASCN
MWLVLLFLLWLSPVTPIWKKGSCSQPQPLCCLGTDHRCRRGSCYCDEFCHVVPDCCSDYHALCSPGNSHGSFLPMAKQADRVSHNARMVLQMVLRMGNPFGPARSNPDWVKSMVHQLLQTNLTGNPFSMTVKGIKKRT